MYDQIMDYVDVPLGNFLVLPNLIDQLLRFESIVLRLDVDMSSSMAKEFKLDPKNTSLYGMPPASSLSSLDVDLAELSELIKKIQLKQMSKLLLSLSHISK